MGSINELRDYRTDEYIRPATSAEMARAIDDVLRDGGGGGIIDIDGRLCYVVGDEPEDMQPTPDHAFTIDDAGERWCPTYIWGGSAGLLCPTCGFMPPDAMSADTLANRTIVEPGYAH